MRKKLAKVFKYSFYTAITLAGMATALVFLFEDEIINRFVTEFNKRAKSEISASKISLTFWQTFPDVSIKLENVIALEAVTNSKDTLLAAEEVFVSFDLISLFSEQYIVNSITLKEGSADLKIDDSGHNNFTLFESNQDSTSSDLSISLKSIELEEMDISYLDLSTQNHHEGLVKNGEITLDWTNDLLNLGVYTDMDLRFLKVGTNAFELDQSVHVDTEMSYDFNTSVFDLDTTNIQLSNATFQLYGWVKAKEDLLDFHLKAPSCDIQNLISLLPESYRNELSQYQSEGNINFDAQLTGNYGSSSTPVINAEFGFKNASFSHPDINARITNANLWGRYESGTIHSKEVLQLKGFYAKLKDNEFSGDLILTNFDDPHINLNLEAHTKIEDLLEVFPIDTLEQASGVLDIDLHLKGAIRHLESLATASKFNASGTLNLDQVKLKLRKNDMKFEDIAGTFLFNNRHLGISQLKGKIGNSDMEFSGLMTDFFGYLFQKNPYLKIDADLKSKHIDLDELLAYQGESEGDEQYRFSISPKFKFQIRAACNDLKFREFKGSNTLKSLKGELIVNQSKVTYKNIGFRMAGGRVLLNGSIEDTKKNLVIVRNSGSVNGVDVSKSFLLLENFGQDFLTNKHLKGTLSGTFSNYLEFNKYLELDLNALLSDLDVKIVDGALNNFGPIMELGDFLKKNKLGRYLKKEDLSDIQFSELKNHFLIKNGEVTVPLMTIRSDASSDIDISGRHKFDNWFDYNVSFALVNYKKQERDLEYGIRPKDENDKLHIHLQMTGYPDDFEITYDKKEIAREVVDEVKDGVKSLFKPIEYDRLYLGVEEDSSNTIDFDVY